MKAAHGMKRRALLLAFCLAIGGAASAFAAMGQDISAAEKQVFEAPHLANLPDSATLRYDYRKTEAGKTVDDEAVVSTQKDRERGRVARVDYLHGERHFELPEVEQAASNPLILYFLEADVRGMHQRLGGQENYFRRRIRLALAESARLQAVDFDYGGKKLKGTEVAIRPFADDPLKDRFKGMAGKSYSFILSPDVPGGVYRMRTVVDDPAGAGKPPLFEESLVLQGDKPRAR